MRRILAAATIVFALVSGCRMTPVEKEPATGAAAGEERGIWRTDAGAPGGEAEESKLTVKVIGEAPEKFADDLLGAAGGKPGADEAVSGTVAKLDEDRIGVFDFKETPMIDVLKVFTMLTGQNVVASKSVMDLKITLFLKDVTPRVALSTMCKLYNLWFTQDDNVIRIITAEEYGKELVVRRDEKTLVFNLKYASALGVADIIAKLMGESVVYEEPEEFESYGHVGTEEETEEGRGARRWRTTYRSRTTYSDASTRRAAVPTTAGFEKELTSAQIEAFEKAAAAAQQVGVTEEALKAARRERAVAYMAVFPRNNSLAVRSVDSHLLRQVKDLVEVFDTVTTQVLLEVKVLEIELGDYFDSLFEFRFHGDHAGSAAPKHTGSTFDSGVSFGTLASPTFEYQFLDKHIEARLQFMQQEKRLKKIATPLVLCANNAPGQFFVGEERPITVNHEYEVRDFEQGGSRATSRPVTEMRDIGMKITISPSINEDATVTMRLLAEIATVNEGGATVELVDSAGNLHSLSIDTVETSNVESIVVAKDGHTLALGGLVHERTDDVVWKVPILGDLPLIKFLFRRTDTEKVKSEIVILIRPHIMMSPAAGDAVSGETVGGLSEHPLVRYGREHILKYDVKRDTLGKEAAP